MAAPDALRRLGGGRWETRDGRFQIEPQSGTWVIVDTAQTNEFGLPLVRGPFPSLTAAKDAIESTRTEGPVQSPLADRIEQARSVAPAEPAPPRVAKPAPKPVPEPVPKDEPTTAAPAEPGPTPEPAWLRSLPAGDRRRATVLIARLAALGIADAEDVARAEVVDGEAALARAALERQLQRVVGSATDPQAAVAAAIEVILAGDDPDLGTAWHLVDDHGRRIAGIDVET